MQECAGCTTTSKHKKCVTMFFRRSRVRTELSSLRSVGDGGRALDGRQRRAAHGGHGWRPRAARARPQKIPQVSVTSRDWGRGRRPNLVLSGSDSFGRGEIDKLAPVVQNEAASSFFRRFVGSEGGGGGGGASRPATV